MTPNTFLCVVILSVFLAPLILCQESSTSVTIVPVPEDPEEDELYKFDSNDDICFRFTWPGPAYDNTTDLNITCKDFTDGGRIKNIPCRQPFVVSPHGAIPDLDDLWVKYRELVSCKVSRGQSCVSYAYYFNNELQNVTYMCAKAIVDNEGKASAGCYTMDENGYETKLCLCEAKKGKYKPCNSASKTLTSLLTISFLLGLLYVSQSFYL